MIGKGAERRLLVNFPVQDVYINTDCSVPNLNIYAYGSVCTYITYTIFF